MKSISALWTHFLVQAAACVLTHSLAQLVLRSLGWPASLLAKRSCSRGIECNPVLLKCSCSSSWAATMGTQTATSCKLDLVWPH